MTEVTCLQTKEKALPYFFLCVQVWSAPTGHIDYPECFGHYVALVTTPVDVVLIRGPVARH